MAEVVGTFWWDVVQDFLCQVAVGIDKANHPMNAHGEYAPFFRERISL